MNSQEELNLSPEGETDGAAVKTVTQTIWMTVRASKYNIWLEAKTEFIRTLCLSTEIKAISTRCGWVADINGMAEGMTECLCLLLLARGYLKQVPEGSVWLSRCRGGCCQTGWILLSLLTVCYISQTLLLSICDAAGGLDHLCQCTSPFMGEA